MAKSFEDFRAGYVGAGKTAEQNTQSNSFADFRKNYVKNESLDLAIMKPFAGPVSIMDQKPEVIDYEGDYTKKVSGQKPTEQSAQFDSASVIKLGAGPLSDNAVAEKVNIGELKISGQSKDGKYTVEKNPDYVPTYTPKPAQVRAATEEELKNRNLEREYGKEDEMGDDFFSWLGKTQDSTLPTAALTGRRADAAGKTVGAAAENVAGSLLNMIGFLGDMAFQGMQTQVAVETGINAEKRGEDGDEVYSQMMDKNNAANAQKEQMFAPVVDTLMSNAEELHQEAYIAAGKEGKFLVDLLYTGTQMAGDLAANLLIPGSGLALMASRVFGQAAYEARMNGADQATQLVYGLKAAVIEYLTEKLGGGAFKKLYGPGVVDNAIESMLGRLLKTDKGRTVIRFLLECTGEGLEEVISDIANPIADRLLGLDDGEGAIITDEDLSQMWYDFALGTALGGMGSAVNLTAGSYEQRNVSLRTAEAAQRALVDSGLESDVNTQSYKLAEKYKKTLDSGRMLSNSQVKKLTEANDAAIRNEVAQQSAIDAVRNATPEHIARLFEQRGEQASPQLVEGISNLVNDRSVTPDQVQAIEQSDNAAQVVQQLAGETVRSNEAPAVEEPMDAWDQDNIVESMFPNEVKSGILDGRDIAQIQGFYDNTGRSIDLNELEAMVSDYIKNKKEAKRNEGRKENSDGGVGRQSGMGAGEQAGGIRGRAGEDSGRDGKRTQRDDRGREEVRRNAEEGAEGRKVSSKELGMRNGTDNKSMTVIPHEKWSPASQRIAGAFKPAGGNFTIVSGIIEKQGRDGVGSVSGFTNRKTGKIVVKSNSRLFSAEQLMLHEGGHLYLNGDTALLDRLREAALNIMTEAELDELTAAYALKWKGLYGDDKKFDMAANGEMSGEEFESFMRKYTEELMCDALAGIERAGARGASKLTEAVRSAFAEETGIDINALLDGEEIAAGGKERTAQRKSAPAEVRNNGPPEELYSADEEYQRNLIAVHGTTEAKLLKALKMEGLPGLSTAVINIDDGLANEGYGEISLVFDKSTIDPKRSGNAVYGADIWSPTQSDAVLERQTSYDGIWKFDSIISDLSESFAGGVFSGGSNLSGVLYSGGDSTTKDIDDVVRSMENYDAVKAAFLADKGVDVEVKYMPKEYHYLGNGALDYILDAFKDESNLGIYTSELLNLFSHSVERTMTDEEISTVRGLVAGYLISEGTPEKIANRRASLYDQNKIYNLLRATLEYDGAGRPQGNEIDKLATREELNKNIDRDEFRNWIRNKIIETGVFTGVEGLYNKTDRITNNGRKSFEQTHLPVTAANIVKLMNKTEQRGVGYFGHGAEGLQALTAEKYSSIDAIRNDKGRLRSLSDEDYKAIKAEAEAEIASLVNEIAEYNGVNDYQIDSAFMDSARGARTANTIRRAYSDYDYSISNELIKKSQQLFEKIAVIPSKYFEAKASRVVGFDEIKTAVIPDDASNELLQALKDKAIPYVMYKAGDNADRLAAIQEMDELRFSADEEGYIEAGDSARMTNSRIDYLIEDSGAGRKKDYAQMWITSINPTDFINLTTDKVQDRKLFDKYPGDYGTTVDEYDFIEGLKSNMRQTPYLNIDEYGNVIGHEGRHRMRALERKGITSAEIVVKFYDSDGRMIKNVHTVNGRLETIERATFSNQMGTGQTASVENLVPLNLDHKDEVLESYGEDHAAENDIRYSADEEGIREYFSGNGYDGYSMSNNARAAYADGEKPISKWTKSEMLTAISEINPDAPAMLKCVSLATLKANLLYKSSWHHTSEYYNKTDFYSIDEDKVRELTQEAVDAWTPVKTVQDTVTYRGNIDYIEWSGTRSRPKAIKHSLKDVIIEERGSFYIALDNDGTEIVRKKKDSNGTFVTNLDEQERIRKALADTEKRYEENSSARAYDLFRQMKSEGYETSASGHLYRKGRKPTRADYDNGIENFFGIGEERLYKDYNNERYVLQTWDGTRWADETEFSGNDTDFPAALQEIDRYSADDALLVEGDPDYADTLSKVREDARRYSATKLEERISNFDGRINGYEETANRTERMELELQDLRNRRKVYAEALKRKKAKNDERRQANESAKTEAKAMAQRITDAQGRNKSKATLRETVFRDFNVQEGRSEAAEIINAFADKYADQGRISRKDLNGLFDALMSRGLFIAEAEDYARELRSHLAGNSVRVPSEVKAEFGDDWINFYRRAWGNNIYLKVDSGSNGIDTWTMELADAFGEGTFDVTADMKTQLERIVDLAEQGKAEKMDLFQMAEYVRKREGRDTADAIIDELYRKLENAVKNYATNAKLEMELTYKNAFQQARDRAIRQENARRAQEKKQLREQQQNTLKQLQALKKMRDRTSNEFREQIDRVLEGIDTIAISAANAMNYSDKYNASWGSIVAMYKEARSNDPNFLPDAYVEKLIERIDGKHLDEMEPADLEQLYQAAVALRTKIYNTQNIIGSETNMLFNEAFEAVSNEMRTADKPKDRYGKRWEKMRNAMNPIHYMEALAGWNPDSVWYKTFARGLEDGERKQKRYTEQSKQMLDEFVRTHKKWLEAADGQGKNGIWYEIKVSPVAEWRKGDQPIFGKPITVYMTPLQKVHMYLESKNYDNLAHMLGGRVFADKELYSNGNKDEAFAGNPIHLAPADVRRISSDLTPEEIELANILERYYNAYAKTEINKVSNELYGFDRAMADNYAPIFTKDTYNTFTPAVIDGTAEGVGHMKTRIKGARTPTYNISAIDAFERHVSQTSRFVGMAIPLSNINSMLNWTQDGKKMQSVIEQEWSHADLKYVQDLVSALNNPNFTEPGYIESDMDKLQSAYIGSVFGFNPSVALKVFGSWALASAELGFENAKGAFTKVDPALIRKYTSEYDVRVRGYSSPEMARLVNSQGAIEKAIQSNKITKELFGGGLMIHTDAIVARSLWAWSEAAVRSENPDLEVGTQEQIDAGESPFYKEVAKRFNKAVGDTQSMYDIMHRSALLRSDKAVDRAFTMFHTDIMQAANLLMKAMGEKAYYRKALKADPENAVLKAKAQWYEKGVNRAAYGVVTSSMLVALVSTLNALLKRRDDFFDEDGFMWDKLGADYIMYVLKDFTGMMPGIPETILGAAMDVARGEKWYEVELMGLSLYNDLIKTGIQFATKAASGKLGAEDVKDLAFLIARGFGLALDNVERYLLGVFTWVAPEIGEAYNNMLTAPDKTDLKGKSGEVLEQDVYDMYKGFGLEREATDELARLYDLGYDKIIYGKTPEHITVDGVEYNLDKEASERYESTLRETLSKLSEVIASDEYQDADDKDRMKMLKRVNSYATETAKAAAVPEYDMAQWVESCKSLLDGGDGIMTVAMMPYAEKSSSSSGSGNDPRYVKLIDAGVEYNNARDIEEKLTMLLPEAGKTNVTEFQKINALALMPIPESDKAAALGVIADDNSFIRKLYNATASKFSLLEICDMYSAVISKSEKGSFTQDNFIEVVAEQGIPYDVASAIWNAKWQPKNNPYD